MTTQHGADMHSSGGCETPPPSRRISRLPSPCNRGLRRLMQPGNAILCPPKGQSARWRSAFFSSAWAEAQRSGHETLKNLISPLKFAAQDGVAASMLKGIENVGGRGRPAGQTGSTEGRARFLPMFEINGCSREVTKRLQRDPRPIRRHGAEIRSRVPAVYLKLAF